MPPAVPITTNPYGSGSPPIRTIEVRSPRGPQLLTDEAIAAFVRGHLPRSMALFRQAVAQDPGDASAWRGLGLAASRMGQKSAAIDAFRKYLALRPRARDAHLIWERLRVLEAGTWVAAGPAREAPRDAARRATHPLAR